MIGLGPGWTGTAALFGSSGARYDARQFSWIGSMTSDIAVALSWHTSPVKTAKDLFTTELVTGGAGVTDQSVMFPKALDHILGTKFKVITGYGGTADTTLAVERGETAGIGAMNFSSVQANKPQWLSEKKINVLVQYGLARHPDLPDVPTVLERPRTTTSASCCGCFSRSRASDALSTARPTSRKSGCGSCARPSTG